MSQSELAAWSSVKNFLKTSRNTDTTSDITKLNLAAAATQPEVRSHHMAKFNVGDRVEWVGGLVSDSMREGTVIRVIPHPELPHGLDEYEVRFRFDTAIFYEIELRLVRGAAGG